MSDRHRANGDAMATVKLFKMLLTKDLDKHIIENNVKKAVTEKRLNPNHKTIIDALPAATGVYYIHDKNGKIIYIGKSKNIKHRVNQHLTDKTRKSKKLQLQVASVTYEKTGSELVALLKESEEIKRNKPIHNRALRRNIFTHALYSYQDNDGYTILEIDIANGEKKPITTFTNRQSAKSFMFKAVEDFNLCQKLTGLYPSKSNCFNYTIKACFGACIGKETPELYNNRVEQLIEKYSFENKDMLIIDQGRDIDEKSVIYIQNGIFKGLGFFDLNYQITNIEVLKSIITPMKNNRDTQHIIQSYLRRNKRLKILHLTPSK